MSDTTVMNLSLLPRYFSSTTMASRPSSLAGIWKSSTSSTALLARLTLLTDKPGLRATSTGAPSLTSQLMCHMSRHVMPMEKCSSGGLIEWNFSHL